MPDEPLVAWSLAEANLFFVAVPCRGCGRGPLRMGRHRLLSTSTDATCVEIKATCDGCGATWTTMFQLPSGVTLEDPPLRATINPTDHPSRILDVGQWITLFRVIMEQAGKETDTIRARERKIQAGQCLAEALKFYDEPDNDLPPPEAFFCDASWERFRQAPEKFSKERLTQLRAALPSPVAPTVVPLPTRKKRWWKR